MKCKACGSEKVAFHKDFETNETLGSYCLLCHSYEKNNCHSASNPDHYNETACLNAIKIATENLDGYEGFCTGNVIWYMWSWKKKNKLEDLNKAMNYIKFLIEHEENKQ